nr:MAG TPA: hypothetical protein [Caudoviricetes sp.]
MGGRGSGSGRGGNSASLGALKAQEKSLDSQIEKLKKNWRITHQKILRGICRADITMCKEKNRRLSQKDGYLQTR